MINMRTPKPPKFKPLILGMEPWMFWLLLAVSIFAIIGPELAWLIRKL